jgi:hypothetical protein
MKTAKSTNRNELSSIHARIEDIMGGSWGQNPTTTRASKRTRSLSGSYAGKAKQQTTPRAWNETFAFAIDG